MSAAKELVALGIPFTQDSFERAVDSGDLNALRLFFRAGYSPNGMSCRAGDFVFNLALVNNQRNLAEELDLFVKSGLDFKKVGDGQGFGKTLSNLLRRPVTQEEDLLDDAASHNGFIGGTVQRR